MWGLQSHRPTRERADRIVQLTKMLNGHADDILGYQPALWDVSNDNKRQALDYARPGGVTADQREEKVHRTAKGSTPKVPRLRPEG